MLARTDLDLSILLKPLSIFFVECWNLVVHLYLGLRERQIRDAGSDASETLRALLLWHKCFLERRLREVPYWVKGHSSLGEIALQLGDFPLLYGSAHAVLTLSKDLPLRARAQYFLGKCYLSRGSAAVAIDYLAEARRALPYRYEILEDLAAAYMATEQYENAAQVIRAVPDEKLSREGQAVKLYLARKK